MKLKKRIILETNSITNIFEKVYLKDMLDNKY